MPNAVIYVITTQAETKMNRPSFEGFLTQLDCKPMYGNKNPSQLTLVQYIKFRVKKKKTEQNRNDEKHSQTGTTVKFHTNHEGARATAIMLRSIAARPS